VTVTHEATSGRVFVVMRINGAQLEPRACAHVFNLAGEEGITGRVERRRDRFRPMASSVSALSSIVANGHQILPTFPPPPLFIPYGGFSRTKCAALHLVLYVVNLVMWCRGRPTLDLWGFWHSQHHIIFCTQTIQRTPIGPFRFARRVARREITRE